jgi:hypothetical protein
MEKCRLDLNFCLAENTATTIVLDMGTRLETNILDQQGHLVKRNNTNATLTFVVPYIESAFVAILLAS